MKKFTALLLALLFVLSSLACGGGGDSGEIDVDVTEAMYVTTVDELYVNYKSYLGKTIRIQGIYGEVPYGDDVYHWVYRVGPNCCSTGGDMCGFEFIYNGDMPITDDWIEVVGELKSYREGGVEFITIDADSVTVMDTRGKENVFS